MTDFTSEADEIINLVYDSPMNSDTRQKLVADWLREFVAAYASGCTGLASDPDGPTLVGADPVTSGAAVLADATDEEVDGFLGAVRDRPEPDAPDGRDIDGYLDDLRERVASGQTTLTESMEEVTRRIMDAFPAAPSGFTWSRRTGSTVYRLVPRPARKSHDPDDDPLILPF